MVTYKDFIKEAHFDVSAATGRMAGLPARRRSAHPVQTVASPPAPTAGGFRQITAPAIAPAPVAPRVPSAVTMRNIPTPVSASKNGRLQPNELTKVGKYNAGAAGKAQWYKDDAYLSPDAARAFLAAQQAYGGTIKINSAYRNLEHQAGVSRQYRVAAQPGRSQHGLGKAIDLQPGTPGYNWMKTNGPRFGWYFAAISGDPYHFEYRA